ncbi:hypothetical protein E2C01_083306 [Portunus trituberculatus]|uniref:Uncharacterized protein n=1 Tax=Portunus trituberculatus TaxID=210409 RepID=A0A5B7J7G8_PORTR|nr:hypothetical protein [Portunus trituberculatus]
MESHKHINKSDAKNRAIRLEKGVQGVIRIRWINIYHQKEVKSSRNASLRRTPRIEGCCKRPLWRGILLPTQTSRGPGQPPHENLLAFVFSHKQTVTQKISSRGKGSHLVGVQLERALAVVDGVPRPHADQSF